MIWHYAHSINRNPVYSTPPLSSFLVVGKSIDHQTLWKMMPRVKLLKIQSLCLSPPTSYFFAFIYWPSLYSSGYAPDWRRTSDRRVQQDVHLPRRHTHFHFDFLTVLVPWWIGCLTTLATECACEDKMCCQWAHGSLFSIGHITL